MHQLLRNRIVQHFAFWCFYLVVYTVNFAQDGLYLRELTFTLMLMPFFVLLTYTQLYVLIPCFLLKKKTALYVLLSIAILLIVASMSTALYTTYIGPVKYGGACIFPGWDKILFSQVMVKSIFSFLMISGLAVAIKLVKQFYQEREHMHHLQKEKLAMELAMLKGQVHPHFLFNTLNNLYALTLSQSAKAPDVVMHLSDLLRYMLYECSADEIPVRKEIELLRKYVELEKLRYGNRIDVSFNCIGDLNASSVAPLILFPFVENSFKYGVSKQYDACWINIYMHLENDKLIFHITNSTSEQPAEAGVGGIGLANIKKRLELLYPGKYELHITDNAGIYSVKLKMQLNHTGTVNLVQPGFEKQKILEHEL